MSFSILWLDRRYGVVLVDEPEEGGTPAEPGPRVRYTPEAGVASRRVRLYDGPVAELANVLFDSGWEPGDYHMIDVPLGVVVELDETYYVQIEIQFDDGRPGLSEMRSFTPGWEAVDDDAPDLTVSKIDKCNAPTVLPRVRLSWEFSTSSGTIVYYLVMRQVDDGPWELLEKRDAPDESIYVDYEASAYVQYRYAVLPVIQDGSMTLVSNIPDEPAEVRLEFDGLWIHRRGNPLESNMRYDSWTPSEKVTQPSELQVVWGRRAPVAMFREQLYRAWDLTGSPAAYDRRDWDTLLRLLDEQYSASGTYVARFGRQRQMAHVALDTASRTGNRSNAVPTIRLTEVSLEERFG